MDDDTAREDERNPMTELRVLSDKQIDDLLQAAAPAVSGQTKDAIEKLRQAHDLSLEGDHAEARGLILEVVAALSTPEAQQ